MSAYIYIFSGVALGGYTYALNQACSEALALTGELK